MAKVTIIIEDVGAKSISFTTEIAGIEGPGDAASPAMALAMATRAMFENGMLAQAAGDALAGIAKGDHPSDVVLASYVRRKAEEEGS